MSNLVSCELVREFVPNTPRIDSVKIKLIFITIYCQFFKMFLYIQHCFSIAFYCLLKGLGRCSAHANQRSET